MPVADWINVSNPRRSRHGPVWPYADSVTYTMPGRRCATLSWRDATVLAADHEPLMAAFGTRRVVDTDGRRRSQVRHGLLHCADVELEAAPDARVAEQPAGMVEEEEQNALLRTPVMAGIQASHESSLTTDGALPAQFREGDLLPHRGKRAIHALKRQLELEGQAGATELLVSVLAQKSEDVVDCAAHQVLRVGPNQAAERTFRPAENQGILSS